MEQNSQICPQLIPTIVDTAVGMNTDYIVSLRLTMGASHQPGFTIGPACRRALFRVGSALECNWRVEGPGVAPHHLMLMWKLGELTLVDVGAGNLLVDDQPFSLCRTVENARISFGSARIVVERMPQSQMPVALGPTGIRSHV